jgi:acetolactate synthase-1/3 small subunit
MKHILSALVQNKPGVLAHVAGMFAARAFNIDSLTVGRTEDPALSRMTIVVIGDDRTVEQVRKQLAKIISVVKVQDFVGQDVVARDLMLIGVACPPEKRAELLALIEMFTAKAVEIGAKYVVIEVSGPETKIEAFIEACRPYGIKNMVRTGTVALARQSRTAAQDSSADSGSERTT